MVTHWRLPWAGGRAGYSSGMVSCDSNFSKFLAYLRHCSTGGHRALQAAVRRSGYNRTKAITAHHNNNKKKLRSMTDYDHSHCHNWHRRNNYVAPPPRPLLISNAIVHISRKEDFLMPSFIWVERQRHRSNTTFIPSFKGDVTYPPGDSHP